MPLKLNKISIVDYAAVRVHPTLRDILKVLAEEDDRSITKYIEKILKEHVDGRTPSN